MCLVDVPEYIPNFEKHVTVGFFFFFGKYCFSCKYTLLRCDRAPASRCLPSTTCLRNLSRRWAPGAPLGRGFCRRPRVPGSASRPCPAVAVPSARAPDPGKEASAEPQATRRPANRAAGLSPTKAAHAAPPAVWGSRFLPSLPQFVSPNKSLKTGNLLLRSHCPHVTSGMERLFAHLLASRSFDSLNCSLFSAGRPPLGFVRAPGMF